jgi:hypothetical protein
MALPGACLDRILAAAFFMAILATGYVTLRRALAAVKERQQFLADFSVLFGKYVQSNAQDESTHVELMRRVTRMQREMGHHGVMAMFRPPFAGVAYRNYEILPNMLPEYRTNASDWVLHSQASQYASLISDALLRYSGAIDEAESDIRREIRNPIAWFRDGVRAIVAAPFLLLQSLGVLSASQALGVTSSTIVRIGSGLLAFITLVAGFVQIATGWDTASSFVHRLLGR